MAFQLPPLPNFSVTPTPQPDFLQKAGQVASLKNMQSETALRNQLAPLDIQEKQQQVQASQTANEAAQLQLASQKSMMKAVSDKGFLDKVLGTDAAGSSGVGFDPSGAYEHLVSQGVLPKDAQGLVSGWTEISKNAALMTKDQISNFEKGHDALAKKLAPIIDMPIDKAATALDALKKDLLKNPIPGVGQQDLAHVYGATLDQLPAMINTLGLAAGIADFHKTQAEAKSAAQKVIPEGGGLSPDSQQQVKKDVAVATNPQIQQGKVDVATAEGRARANIEHEFAVRNNAALATVPTHLVAPATSAAEKANKEYADAKSVSDRMNATMDAAKKGNVVSYQIIPEEGTLQITTSQGVHRINKTEIDQYEGGGSLWQRLEGHLGKALTGKSIPDSVLKDMAEIQKIQADGSKSRYENTLSSINQTYGAKFQPVEMTDLGKKAPKEVHYKIVNGQLVAK